MTIRTMGMTVTAWLLAIGIAAAAPPPHPKRMGGAKDFIADEQWGRAIVELQAAASDPKEANREEALFWLAHSQHQVGDDASALQSIATLERAAPASRWKRPAQSLRIEIAQRMRRDDVLWMTAAPPAPPPAPPARPGFTPRPAAIAPPTAPAPTAPPPALPVTPVAAPPGVPAPPAPPRIIAVRPARPLPTPPAPPDPGSEFWLPPPGAPPTDITLRVQALTGLIDLDKYSAEAIPLLREIALDRNSPDEARLAVFVLGQSHLPEARRTVVEVAH